MRKLFGYANEYVKQSDWRDLALIKICLCSMGLLIGMALPKKTHNKMGLIALGMFCATYLPIMCKLFRIAKQND